LFKVLSLWGLSTHSYFNYNNFLQINQMMNLLIYSSLLHSSQLLAQQNFKTFQFVLQCLPKLFKRLSLWKLSTHSNFNYNIFLQPKHSNLCYFNHFHPIREAFNFILFKLNFPIYWRVIDHFLEQFSIMYLEVFAIAINWS